jgi:RNA methyltransferase, TrmH family
MGNQPGEKTQAVKEVAPNPDFRLPSRSTQPGADSAELIHSRRNPLVRRLRSLQEARGRREHGLLLLEGRHLLEECLALGLTPDLVLATPAWIERQGALWQALASSSRRQAVSEEVLAQIASTQHPDGVLATLVPPAPAPQERPGFVLALDRLQDPGNLGTLLRTARAAGVDEVWLAQGADPHSPKVLRASSGAALALPLQRLSAVELVEQLERAAAAGLQRVATLVSGGRPYWQIDWTRPTLLLLGNEGAGLAPQLAALADERVTVPHSPAVESLNVAVAAAPLLLERWRQFANRPGGRMPSSSRSSSR